MKALRRRFGVRSDSPEKPKSAALDNGGAVPVCSVATISIATDREAVVQTQRSTVQNAHDNHGQPDAVLSLWTQAYERLRRIDSALTSSFEAIFQDGTSQSSNNYEQFSAIVVRKRDEMFGKQWTLRFMNHRPKVRDQIQRIAKVAEYAKGFGAIIASADPVHAGLPWAAINVLLTVR